MIQFIISILTLISAIMHHVHLTISDTPLRKGHFRPLRWERGFIDFINACTAIDLSCSKGFVMYSLSQLWTYDLWPNCSLLQVAGPAVAQYGDGSVAPPWDGPADRHLRAVEQLPPAPLAGVIEIRNLLINVYCFLNGVVILLWFIMKPLLQLSYWPFGRLSEVGV